ncbi:hypothetical protein M885DRAFT_625768 [Pelagophyceae sp. CCMP2097]|nr:hypothetical protein M885DRAFT_625768 [Pelagophyceae sp. CCMP2097]
MRRAACLVLALLRLVRGNGCWDAESCAAKHLATVYDVAADSALALGDVNGYYAAALKPGALDHCDDRAGSLAGAIPGCLYLVDGAVVHARDSRAKAKFLYTEIVLREVATFFRKSNVSFFLDVRATGAHARHPPKRKPSPQRHAPVFSIAKKGNDAHALASGLVPNPYFLQTAWWANYTSEFLARAAARPWASRYKRVLFRGSCGPFSAERMKLAGLPLSDLLDVGITAKLGNYTSTMHCVDEQARRTFANGASPEVRLALAKGRVTKKRVEQMDVSKYRYILSMPGCATGSYSRSLQHALMHGAVVLIWQSPAREWYYPVLRNRVHYMEVNESTLLSVVAEVEASPSLQKTLLAGSLYAATRVLSPESLANQWRAALGPLVDRQRDKLLVLPDEACTCQYVAAVPRRCSFCDMADQLVQKFQPETRRPGHWV